MVKLFSFFLRSYTFRLVCKNLTFHEYIKQHYCSPAQYCQQAYFRIMEGGELPASSLLSTLAKLQNEWPLFVVGSYFTL